MSVTLPFKSGATDYTGKVADGTAAQTPIRRDLTNSNSVPSLDQVYGPDPYFPNSKGPGNGVYPGPVNYVDASQLSGGSDTAGFNQLMMRQEAYYDPFLQERVKEQPSWWRDRIPRGNFPLYHGLRHETRIFRGTAYPTAGLTEWAPLDTGDPNGGSPAFGSDGNGGLSPVDRIKATTANPCQYPGFTTPTYGWEAMHWSPMRRTWGTDPICADQFRFIESAMQQLSWILRVAIDGGSMIQEIWNRDNYVYFAIKHNRGFVMSKDFRGDNGTGEGHWYYNPFAKVKVATGYTNPIIVIDASVDMEPVNFDMLDIVRDELCVEAADQAISSGADGATFGLMISSRDVDNYIRGNESERRLWIEANPQALISHYNLSAKTFRHWAIMEDPTQMRFKLRKLDSSYSPGNYFESTADGANIGYQLEGKPVYIAEYIERMVPVRTGLNGTPIYGINPEWLQAEIAVAPVFMNKVFTNLVVPTAPNSLGQGTSFQPITGTNGKLQWLNIPHPTLNPLGRIGNFFGLYEVAAKPEVDSQNAIAFLYRRCVQPLRSLCPAENPKINPDYTTAAVTSGTKTTAVVDLETGVWRITLDQGARLAIGDRISLTKGGVSTVDATVLAVPSTSIIEAQLRDESSEASDGGTASDYVGATVALI